MGDGGWKAEVGRCVALEKSADEMCCCQCCFSIGFVLLV